MTQKPPANVERQRGLNRIISVIIGIVVVIGGLIATFLGGGPTQAPTPALPTSTPPVFVTLPPGEGVQPINFPLGFGAQQSFWRVYFTAPSGSRDPSTYVGGLDAQLAADINLLSRSLDIAAFEFNSPILTQAVIAAHQRGVRVRMVTDNEHGLLDRASTIPQLIAAGIPVVDDKRSALMHNKFMILDSSVVWTGSWNFTINDTYRNNNNALALRSQKAVQNYQSEFNEMFEQGRFGPRSPANTPFPRFRQNDIPIQVYFSPEDKLLADLIAEISAAQRSIRFMNFSFTDYDTALAILRRAQAGVFVQGIWETTGSETAASELRTLFCAGLDVRQDGNPFILHHKVFIIDDTTVVTGSFNISTNATTSNDDNLLIIGDPSLAAQYRAEFERRWAEARRPTTLTCQ